MNSWVRNCASKLQFELFPIAPFRLDLTAWVLKRRPEDELHQWDGEYFRRVLVMQDTAMLIEVKQVASGANPRLQVTVPHPPRLNNLEEGLIEILNQVLGLNIDLTSFYEMSLREPRLAELAIRFRGVKPPSFPSVFECFVCAVACQQLSLHVGILLLNRLVETFGQSAIGTQQRAFPQPSILARADLDQFKAMSFSTNKARYIIEMARAIETGEIKLNDYANLNDADLKAQLTGIRGIGKWTAEYMMLRGYGKIDAYPIDDSGARSKLKKFLALNSDMDRQELQGVVNLWKPDSGLLYFHVLLYLLAEEGHVK